MRTPWRSGPDRGSIDRSGRDSAMVAVVRRAVCCRGIGVVFSAIVGLAPLNANGRSLTPSKADLCDKADLVVIGTVAGTRSEWQTYDFGRIIVTDATISVEAVIHGPPVQWVTVTVQGGQVGDTRLTTSDDPYFGHGDRVLLVLHTEPGKAPVILGGRDGAVGLRVNAQIPSERELRGMWRRQCEEK